MTTQLSPMGGVGIFGGSFNPVHIGHVQLAQQIQEKCGFNPLYIVPNRHSPHKDPNKTDPNVRLEMVKLAFEGVPNTIVSPYEVEREGPSYAVNTIEHFRRAHKDKPVSFIIGTDAFYDLPQWYAFPDILELCSFIVVTRAGWDEGVGDLSKLQNVIDELKEEKLIKDTAASPPFARAFKTQGETTIAVFETKLPEVSSTEIRLRLQLGENVHGLVPDAVERYLKTSGLYGTRKLE